MTHQPIKNRTNRRKLTNLSVGNIAILPPVVLIVAVLWPACLLVYVFGPLVVFRDVKLFSWNFLKLRYVSGNIDNRNSWAKTRGKSVGGGCAVAVAEDG